MTDEELFNQSVPAVKKETAVAKTSNPRGFEDFDQSDLIIPQACIAQGLSKVITEGVEGIRIGTIYNNVTNEVMPQIFVPILVSKIWLKFADGELVYRATSPQDPNVIADEDAWKSQRIQVLALFDKQTFPTIIQFGGASFKEGKRFVTMMKFLGEDMFARCYKLSTEMQTNNKGTFGVFKVSSVGATEPKMFKQAETLYKAFLTKSKEIVAHEAETYTTSTTEENPY